MSVVPRDAWGARPPVTTSPIAAGASVTVHWEGTTLGDYPASSVPAMLRSIQAFHMDTRGWWDIAYNLIVDRSGQVWEGRGVQVRSAANGTAAANAESLAVCALVGPGDTIPPELFDGVAEAIGVCRAEGAAGDVLHVHHDWVATACPGPDLTAFVQAGAVPPQAAPGPVAPIDCRDLPPGPPDDGSRVLSEGDRGDDVAAVQAGLAGHGHPPANSQRSDGSWDGIFGPGTTAAVDALQQASGLVVDGVVGRQVRCVLSR